MPIQSGQQAAEVPIIRYAPKAIHINGIDITAQRASAGIRKATEPDTIIISVRGGGNGNFDTYLSPALLVQIVNTQLSDEERAFILRAPDERDAQIAELNERLNDTLDQLGATTDAYNAELSAITIRGVGAA